jgi:hypothetical protein
MLVCRLLSAAIGDTALPPSNADRTKQQDLCSHMNRCQSILMLALPYAWNITNKVNTIYYFRRHRSAQHIQRASTALHTILFFRGRPSVEPAYVLSVLGDRVSVIVPK